MKRTTATAVTGGLAILLMWSSTTSAMAASGPPEAMKRAAYAECVAFQKGDSPKFVVGRNGMTVKISKAQKRECRHNADTYGAFIPPYWPKPYSGAPSVDQLLRTLGPREQAVVDEINARRIAAGRPAYTTCRNLDAAVQGWVDMTAQVGRGSRSPNPDGTVSLELPAAGEDTGMYGWGLYREYFFLDARSSPYSHFEIKFDDPERSPLTALVPDAFTDEGEGAITVGSALFPDGSRNWLIYAQEGEMNCAQ